MMARNDLLVSSVIRTHEQQIWFLSEHLIDEPLTEAALHGKPKIACHSKSF
jgi:hypothetical protein